MARPTKTGLDYYPMDVGFLRDKKVRLLRAEFGASSVLFVLYVWGKAYEGDGYFLAWDKDELLLAADELREQPTYISEVLQGCLKRSIFDERVFQMFGVLTSAGIQRRYLRGCEKRDVITIVSEYWLLNISSKSDVPAGVRAKLALVGVTGGNNDVNSPENPENSPGNPQSKVKESKVKESRVLGGAPAAPAPPHTPSEGENLGTGFVPPTVEEIAEYVRSRGSCVDPQVWVDYYAARGWMTGRAVMKDWRAAVRASETWERWQKPGGRSGVKTPSDYESGESFV
jgi:hypothetical protein